MDGESEHDSDGYLRMGWLPYRGFAGLHLPASMRNFLALLSFLILPFPVLAAGYATAIVGGGAVKSGSSWSVKGASATAVNGAFYTLATVTAAGKLVTMPASASFAANAASFAVSAVRLNPTALVVGSVASWLLMVGLEYVNGQWMQRKTGATMFYVLDTNGAALCSTCGAGDRVAAVNAYRVSIGMPPYDPATRATWNDQVCNIRADCLRIFWFVDANHESWPTAPISGTATTAPAVEADFNAAGAGVLPDAAAQQLARADVPIPVNDPVLNPSPIVENYGQPFIDPVTGKTVQTKTRLTPEPTLDNPYAVRLDTYGEEVAPAPAPQPGDPVKLPDAEQPKDPCLDNPDRVGCMDAGKPDDVDLGTSSVQFTVTPVTIGGSGACPANPSFQAAGRTFTIDYAPMCNAASWLKPLILAMAWFAAAMIISGAVRES